MAHFTPISLFCPTLRARFYGFEGVALRWFVVLGVMAFCACSTKLPTTEELQSQTHIPQSFANLKNPDTHASDALKQYLQEHTPIQRFYTLFDDAQLHALLDIALERNTNVLIMASRLKQAKSQVKINTASMFPTINGNIGTNYTDRRTQSQSLLVRPGTNSTSANLSLSWELDLFGKLNALRQSSKKDEQSAQANLQNAQISLLAEVSTLYFTLRDNAYNIALSTQILENLREIESIGEQQYQKGLIDINTYKSLKATLITQQNTLESLRYTYEQNKNALLVLLDINDGDLREIVQFLDTPKDLPTIARFDVQSIPSEVLLERPDVRSSVFALHSQLYKVTNAKAARLPTISLNGSIGQILYSNVAANSLVFQIANSIAAPLLNRVSLRENQKIQQELSKEAFHTLQNTINTALSEIENALFDRDSKQRQVRNNKAVLELSKQAYESDVAQWERGVIDLSAFLTNKNAHLSTQAQYFSSQVSEILAMVTLFKAFGGAVYVGDYSLQEGHSAFSDKSLILRSVLGHYRLGSSLHPSLGSADVSVAKRKNNDFSSKILECQGASQDSKTNLQSQEEGTLGLSANLPKNPQSLHSHTAFVAIATNPHLHMTNFFVCNSELTQSAQGGTKPSVESQVDSESKAENLGNTESSPTDSKGITESKEILNNEQRQSPSGVEPSTDSESRFKVLELDSESSSTESNTDSKPRAQSIPKNSNHNPQTQSLQNLALHH